MSDEEVKSSDVSLDETDEMGANKPSKKSSKETPTKSLKDIPKTVKEIELDDLTGVSQENLEYLAENFPCLQSLTVSMEYDDDAPVLTFQFLSFPKLESLSLCCVGLSAVHFEKENYPNLSSVSLDNIVGDIGYIRLDLPKLKGFNVEHATIRDTSDFGPSICRCTNIEHICCYKLWGLDNSSYNKLYMPNCESLGLYRSDDLSRLEVYAPKLNDLNLQACYALNHVRLVDEPFGRPVKCFCCGKCDSSPNSKENDAVTLKRCGRCRMAQYCSKECQEKHWDEHAQHCGKKVRVNLVNANIDKVSMKHLRNNPRIKKICRNPDNLDMFGFGF